MAVGTGAGTGREPELGRGWKPQHGNGDGGEDGNESSSVNGNGDEDGDRDENKDGIGEGGGEAKKLKKPHKSCRRDVENGRDLGEEKKT